MTSQSIFIAGHRGLVGSALTRRFGREPGWRVVTRTRAELDLANADAVDDFFRRERPNAVILAAAKVGGIKANNDFPVDFLLGNLDIQSSVLKAAHKYKVEKLLFLGSSCIYPKFAPQPIREESLLTGLLEPTNEAYAIAKIAGIKLAQAYRRQFGCRFISAMPTNLYGPGDNFALESSHVLPAMLRKFHEGKRARRPAVILWGDGSPRREFLHVDDLAEACRLLVETYDSEEIVNIGCGEDLTIRDLASLAADAVGYRGEIVWDTSKPNGTPRKLLDVSRILGLGWRPQVALADGIRTTYQWFLDHIEDPALRRAG
ncbi:MAG: GDP-L-fucose synthase [Planctomycetes bacterium]|nr:GDP-L-fucose synthase [Planctomycetota bacterium]